MEKLLNRTTFITGSKKGAGKTTFLNYALAGLSGRTKIAFLTCGLDGEAEDSAFSTPKPRVFAPEGSFFVTASSLLKASGASCEILDVFSAATPLGPLVLARAERGGAVEICGPQTNADMSEILETLRRRGAETILVDGAASRLTQTASGENSGFVYVLKADSAGIESAVDSAKLIIELSRVPKAPPCHCEKRSDEAIYHLYKGMRLLHPTQQGSQQGLLRPHDGLAMTTKTTQQGFSHLVPGALTESRLDSLPEKGAIVIEDFTKVFLPLRIWRRLAGERKIFFLKKFELFFICVNLSGVSRAEFEKKLGCPASASKIMFNPYMKESAA